MSRFLRPSILAMTGYAPGEQPREDGIIKLNTNENPYPPSPRALAALAEFLSGDRLRKYPDPLGLAFRQTAGRVLGVDPDAILIGNGSDDILTILTRAFVPEQGLVVSPTPSYLLYRTLAQLQGARFQTVPFTAEWGLSRPWPERQADLTLIANPNSPTGTVIATADLESFAQELQGPLVVDEAYVDFAEGSALSLHRLENVIVTRTLSKSYSLAGLRFGFGIAAPELVRELVKVKDSYNCDSLSLACAAAALEDQEYMRATRGKIVATRGRLEKSLAGLGFAVLPSQANFVWARRADRAVKPIFQELKRRRILVRYMNYDGYEGLRISVGTEQETDRLLEELRAIVQGVRGYNGVAKGDQSMASASATKRGSVTDLLTAVKQLSTGELREFRRGFAALVDDDKGENGDRNEKALLSSIRKNSALSAKEQRRFDRLRRKRQAERLAPDEEKELQETWQRVERMDAERLVAVAELARKRGSSVRQLMVKLGIEDHGKIF